MRRAPLAVRRSAVVARRSGVLACLVVVTACGSDRDAPRGDPVAGERIAESVEPSCDRCHTLERAGWEGEIGPSLDGLRPGYARVLEALRAGPGLMPAYDDLSAKDQHDIAAFVSRAASDPS